MSSSRSSTAQSSWAQDNRRVIGEGGVSAENSTVNVLDNGAINAAFDFAQSSGNQAFALAGKAVSEAGAGQARVLDFGADALSGALGFGDAQNARVLDFGADALAAAFQYGAEANTQAQDAIGQTASLVKNAYEDAKGRGAMTDYILIGAILVMGLVAWGAIKK